MGLFLFGLTVSESMPAPINARPDKFEDYPSSEQLYELFTPANLTLRIQNKVPTASAADIGGHLTRLLTLIDFGTVKCANHNFLIGTPNATDPYPDAATATTTARLLGYRIGEPTPAGTTRPRVVITAGVHAREMLPPGAVANYFSQLLVNYIQGKLTSPSVLPDITHEGFKYQAGPLDDDEPGMENPVNIKAWLFPSADLRRFIEQLEIIVLPVVNPGGRDFVVTRATEAQQNEGKRNVRRNWRKNRRLLPTTLVGTGTPSNSGEKDGKGHLMSPIDKTVAVRPIGADVNRNANFAWDVYKYYLQGIASKNDNSSFKTFEDYRGDGINSELETCAMLAALTTNAATDMRTAQLNFASAPGPEASLSATPVAPFLGALFHLDVHSALGGIYTPWGTETPSPTVGEPSATNPAVPVDPSKAADPTKNFMNTAWDTRRDGPKVPGYQEFLPSRIQFGTNPRPYDLLTAHTDFANNMRTAIEQAVTEPAEEIPDNTLPGLKARMGLRSRYEVACSAAGLYVTPGTANDYAVALSIRGITNLTTKATSYTNPTRNGPTIGITIELGKLGDGDFAPVNKPNDQYAVDTSTGTIQKTPTGLYSKVEREAFAAIHSFLVQSIRYAFGSTPK